MTVLNLKEEQDSRIIVIGSIEGDYYTLIDFLHLQEFSYKDLLILTGNFINNKEINSEKLIEFIKTNDNVFSVRGYNEDLLINSIELDTPLHTIFNLKESDMQFLKSLPFAIELNSDITVVNTTYIDKNSLKEEQVNEIKIYENSIISEGAWYNQTYENTICFTNKELKETNVNCGYNLGNIDNNLHALIMYKENDPILIKI